MNINGPDLVGDKQSAAHAYPSSATEAGGTSVPALAKIWAVVVKRKWILIGAVALAMIIGLVLTLLATPKYTATATLQLQREQRSFTNVESAQRQGDEQAGQEYYPTQIGLLKSESLASQVASSLQLQDDPAFFKTQAPKLAKAWFPDGRLSAGAPSRADRLRAAGSLLLDDVSISPERTSQLVHVSFTSPDPGLAQRVANAWGAQFIQSSLNRRYDTTSYARNFLEQRLAQLRSRIDQSERSLVEYGAQQGIITVPTAGDPDGAASGGAHDVPLVATDLAAMNTELAKATAARVIAQSRLSSGSSQASPEALGNVAISTLRARRAEVASDYAKLLQQFDPNFPAATALRSQLAVLDRDIAAEEGRVGSSIQDTYKSAAAREADLQGRVTQLKQSYLDLRRRSIQYDIMQRDVDTSRQLYAALLQRYKEIGVASGVGVNNISIIDPADLPQGPSSPKLFLNLAASLLVGLILGAGLALGLEQFNLGISNPADVQSLLGVSLLGAIPKMEENPFAALEDPKSVASEAYASIQTTMSLSTDHGFPRTLVVTSSRPSEGKSTTSYALARRLAQLKKSVVLVDGDMRSPSIAQLLGLNNRVGLSNYLAGESNVSNMLQPTRSGELMVLTAGITPPNTTELLAGDRVAKLLVELLAMVDHVIIDSPPVMGLADTPLLASRAEGAVFVIEAESTNREVARVALGRLLSAQVKVLGAVLSKLDRKRTTYGYGYGYGYSYGSGQKDKG